MGEIRRVLVGLDGTEEAEEALHRARAIAASEGSELLLVTVVPSFRTVPSHDVILLHDLVAAASQARDYLDRVALETPGAGTLVRVSPLSAAEVGEELLAVALEERCDLVVTTVHAMGRGFSRVVGRFDRHGVALLLVPGRAQRAPRGRVGSRLRVPRFVVPTPRPALAFGSLFFFSAGARGVAILALPGSRQGPQGSGAT